MKLVTLSLTILLICSCNVSLDIYEESDYYNNPLQRLCLSSPSYGKSIGIIGGSYTIAKESKVLIDSLRYYLGANVYNYGKSGYGFSILQGSFQDIVDSVDVHDIYLLWASTNDIRNNREVGSYLDYTLGDNFNESSRLTQCGGINYAIRKLREKNHNCLIVFVSSNVFFSKIYGYCLSESNEAGFTLIDYVEGQKNCCANYNVPFVNLLQLISLESIDFNSDLLHLNNSGYAKLVVPIITAIANPGLI